MNIRRLAVTLTFALVGSGPLVGQAPTSPAGQPDATAPAKQQAVPAQTAEPAPQPDQPKEDETKFNALETEFAKTRADTEAELGRLQKDITQLASALQLAQSAAKKNANLAELLAKTNQRIALLESLNNQRFQGGLDLDKIRYRTGRDLLVLLIRNSGKLKVESGLAANLVDFDNLVNPTRDDAFNREISALDAKLNDANKGVLEKLKGSPVMANPYVSMAVSIGSFLVSGYARHEKVSRITNVVCAVHFTSRAAPDLAYIQDGLKSIDHEVRTFQARTKSHFADYVGAVGYGRDYDFERYKAELRTGYDPTDKTIDAFFDGLKTKYAATATAAAGTPEEVGKLRFQIETVRDDLGEYERILKHVDDFLGGYIAILEKNKTMLSGLSQSTMCQSYVSADKQALLNQLIDGVKKNQQETREEYVEDIPGSSKRVLFGIQ